MAYGMTCTLSIDKRPCFVICSKSCYNFNVLSGVMPCSKSSHNGNVMPSKITCDNEYVMSSVSCDYGDANFGYKTYTVSC